MTYREALHYASEFISSALEPVEPSTNEEIENYNYHVKVAEKLVRLTKRKKI